MDTSIISHKLARHRATLGTETPYPVRPLRTASGIGDGTAIYFAGDDYLLHLSPAAHPQVAEEQRAAIVHAKAALPEALARHIIDVVDHGEMDGRSWILQPLLTPFSSNSFISKFQRLCVRPQLLQWLRDLAFLSSASSGAIGDFKRSLGHLANMANLPKTLRSRAQEGMDLIADGQFKPSHVPMHGDLWKGNILLKSRSHFVVIDWRGSKMNGYGIFDLIRYAQCEGLGSRRLLHELQIHARASDIQTAHTDIPLLGALGHFAQHLGQFPENRFIEMAANCHDTWERAIG